MHELSICQALIEQITTIAHAHKAVGVARIKVAIGPLAGVEPALLEHAFSIAQCGSIAANAMLIIEQIPLQVYCQNCEQTTIATETTNLTCKYCGDWHTKLTCGDQMLLSQIELLLP